MTRALKADDLDAWAAADERFHQGLVELAGNRTLMDAVQRLADRAHRARMFTLRLRPKPVRSTREHLAMLDRIRAGDAAGAVDRVPGAPRTRQPRTDRDVRALSAQPPLDATREQPREQDLRHLRPARRRHRRRGDRRHAPAAGKSAAGRGLLAALCVASRRRPALQGLGRSAAAGHARGRARVGRDPVRRDGLAGNPLSRRHRDRAAARSARRARAVCRRASRARDSGHAAAARRSARTRDRPGRRARVDRGPVRVARQGRDRRTTRKRATPW